MLKSNGLKSKIFACTENEKYVFVGAYSFCNSRIAFTSKSVVDSIQSYFSMNVQTHIKILVYNFRTKMLPVQCQGYSYQFVPLYRYQCCQWQFEKLSHHQNVCPHHIKGKYLYITLNFKNRSMNIRLAVSLFYAKNHC